MNLIGTMRTAVPLHVAITSAEYIRKIWENPNIELDRPQSQQQLTNYIANLIYRVSPSVATIFAAVYYIGRLRRLYPKANGETGCGHRLFTVALLIAYRYLEQHPNPDESFYCLWSQHSGGIFQPSDLFRMELEFVAFLKFNLYTPYDDFEYFVERVYNSENGQVVPHCLVIPELTRPVGGGPIEQDASVPDLSC
jgi:hypothetical protein